MIGYSVRYSGQPQGPRLGMVPQAPQGVDKLVQRAMGRLCLSVFMLSQVEREHQLPPKPDPFFGKIPLALCGLAFSRFYLLVDSRTTDSLLLLFGSFGT